MTLSQFRGLLEISTAAASFKGVRFAADLGLVRSAELPIAQRMPSKFALPCEHE
jgi:hypothetical protein